MQNENHEKQKNQIKRNPTRGNTNNNQGQNNEQSFGYGNKEANPRKQMDNKEIDLDRSGVSRSTGTDHADFTTGQEAGSEGIQGTTQAGSQGQQGLGPNTEIQQQQPQTGQESGKSAGSVKQSSKEKMGTDEASGRDLGAASGSEQGNAAVQGGKGSIPQDMTGPDEKEPLH